MKNVKPISAGNGYESGKNEKARNAEQVRRGDIFYADLSPVVGSEQGGLRPVLIIQNDVGNRYSPTVIAAAITSRLGKTKLPTHIDVARAADGSPGLQKDSVILLEQIRTLDKRRLREKMGHLDNDTMRQVNTAISVSFGLGVPAATAAASGGASPAVPTPAASASATATRAPESEAAVTPAGAEDESGSRDGGPLPPSVSA